MGAITLPLLFLLFLLPLPFLLLPYPFIRPLLCPLLIATSIAIFPPLDEVDTHGHAKHGKQEGGDTDTDCDDFSDVHYPLAKLG